MTTKGHDEPTEVEPDEVEAEDCPTEDDPPADPPADDEPGDDDGDEPEPQAGPNAKGHAPDPTRLGSGSGPKLPGGGYLGQTGVLHANPAGGWTEIN